MKGCLITGEGVLTSCVFVTWQLNLRNQGITAILPGAVPATRVKWLELQDNLITNDGLPDGVFDSTELERVFLSNNKLTQLPAGLFSAMPKVHTLHLQHNDISNVRP